MKKTFLACMTATLMLTACSNDKSEEKENTAKKTEEVTTEEKTTTEQATTETAEDKVYELGETVKTEYMGAETTYTIKSAKWIDQSKIVEDVSKQELSLRGKFNDNPDKVYDVDYEPVEFTIEYKSPVDYETIISPGRISTISTEKPKSRANMLNLKDRPDSNTKIKKGTPTTMKSVWLVPKEADYYILDVSLLEYKTFKIKINKDDIQ